MIEVLFKIGNIRKKNVYASGRKHVGKQDAVGMIDRGRSLKRRWQRTMSKYTWQVILGLRE
jgi:hypothetical protein